MKKCTSGILAMLLCLTMLAVPGGAAEYLIPVGQVIGLELADQTVTVAAMEPNGCAQQAGLQVGDRILNIDGKAIGYAEDVKQALCCSKGLIHMKISRQGKEQTVKISPAITADGPKLGIFLKQGVTGIGTVTWYDPDSGRFGTLGHGVSDGQGGLVKMVSGKAYRASVVGVVRGQSGKPGQLQGTVTAADLLAPLTKNTAQGVFGAAEGLWQGQAMEVAEAGEVCVGPAIIRSTVEGTMPRDYSVEILKIYPNNGASGRNLMLKVTDPALLETTGGIVQGMSGSPIIQDGKLVGAVTHVLVNDPTRGYGIFIENMLDAAG